jgi:hypothetical protein
VPNKTPKDVMLLFFCGVVATIQSTSSSKHATIAICRVHIKPRVDAKPLREMTWLFFGGNTLYV